MTGIHLLRSSAVKPNLLWFSACYNNGVERPVSGLGYFPAAAALDNVVFGSVDHPK
jgi:hypothetical protein